MLGKFLSPAMPYLLGGAVIGGLILSGLLYFKSKQYDNLLSDSAAKIERAEHNAIRMNEIVRSQEETISGMMAAQAAQRARDKQRAEQLAMTQKSLDEERRKNDSYRSRWAKIADKKPSLLSNRINRAADERVQRIAVATCRADCDKDGNQDNSDKAAAKTGANPPE